MQEPTRVLGNVSSAIAAAGAALMPILPAPWGVVAAGVGALLSVLVTELNRSKVSPSAKVMLDMVAKAKAAEQPPGASLR